MDDDYALQGGSSDDDFEMADSTRKSARKGKGVGATGPRQPKGGRRQLKGVAAHGYSWEEEYHRSWDVLQEDEEGSLMGVVAGIMQAGKRKRTLKDTTALQRGIIRHLVLVIDMSAAMAEQDLRPSRYGLTMDYVIQLITEYYEQNPISQMAIVGMRDGVAMPLSHMSGNPHDHITALQMQAKSDPRGDPSLQNALEMARASLFNVPIHSTREILVLFGALVSADPGDIHKTVKNLVTDHVSVRVIGLAAQIAICREICRATNNGDDSYYGVVLNEVHFKELLFAVTTPPAPRSENQKTSASLIEMGFPSRFAEKTKTLCACHSNFTRGGYLCPRCSSKVCSLPMECAVCSLTLVLSTHLARSYHHLFPLRNWLEVSPKFAHQSKYCYGCQRPFPPPRNPTPRQPSGNDQGQPQSAEPEPLTVQPTSRYECTSCHNHFCVECDVFAHEVVYECPGCLTERSKTQSKHRP